MFHAGNEDKVSSPFFSGKDAFLGYWTWPSEWMLEAFHMAPQAHCMWPEGASVHSDPHALLLLLPSCHAMSVSPPAHHLSLQPRMPAYHPTCKPDATQSRFPCHPQL